jgi:sulfur-oxidizing protein SoxY
VETRTRALTRRAVVTAAVAGGGGLVSTTLVSTLIAGTSDDAVALIERLLGKTPTASDRLHLIMPRLFPNGYTVPMTIQIDTPMTETDHVRHIRVFAPRNPLIEVAAFHLIPNRSEPRVSTRIRLAEPQFVLAVAEMNDGALLMTRTWVEVATNGCE